MGDGICSIFLKFSKILIINLSDRSKGKIHIHLYMTEIGKIVFGPYRRFSRNNVNIPKAIIRVFLLIELFQTAIEGKSVCNSLSKGLIRIDTGVPATLLMLGTLALRYKFGSKIAGSRFF